MIKTNRESGAIAIVAVLLLLILLSLFFFGMNVSRIFYERSRLADAAETAIIAVAADKNKNKKFQQLLVSSYIINYMPNFNLHDSKLSLEMQTCQLKNRKADDYCGVSPFIGYMLDVKTNANSLFKDKKYNLAARVHLRKFIKDSLDLIFVADYSASMGLVWNNWHYKYLDLMTTIFEITRTIAVFNNNLPAEIKKIMFSFVPFNNYLSEERSLCSSIPKMIQDKLQCGKYKKFSCSVDLLGEGINNFNISSSMQNIAKMKSNLFTAKNTSKCISNKMKTYDDLVGPVEVDLEQLFKNPSQYKKIKVKIIGDGQRAKSFYGSNYNNYYDVNLSQLYTVDLTTNWPLFISKLFQKKGKYYFPLSKPFGSTSSYQGISKAGQIALNSTSKNKKTVVIVISDGVDSCRKNAVRIYQNNAAGLGICQQIKNKIEQLDYIDEQGQKGHKQFKIVGVGFPYNKSKGSIATSPLKDCVGVSNTFTISNKNSLKGFIMSQLVEEIGHLYAN